MNLKKLFSVLFVTSFVCIALLASQKNSTDADTLEINSANNLEANIENNNKLESDLKINPINNLEKNPETSVENTIENSSESKIESNLANNLEVNSENKIKTLEKLENNSENKKPRKVIDKIEAVIYHPDGAKIITTSDIKPGLDGTLRTLEQVVLENMMVIDGNQVKHLEVTDKEVDKYISQLQTQNSLSRDDVVELFRQAGYTFKEGYEQLRRQALIDRVINYRVRDQIIISEQELQDYYKNNPSYANGSYQISQTIIPYGEGLRALRKIKIQQAIDSGEISKLVTWPDPITLTDDEISPEKAYIKDLTPGSIVLFNEAPDGFVIIKIVSKSDRALVPFEEAQPKIRRAILNERFENALAAYKDKLFKNIKVKYN